MKSLREYGISERTGFLPELPPLHKISDPYFEPWETIVSDLSHLLVAGKLRSRIDKMPVLDTNKLASLQDTQRSFLVLCLLSHAYVWGAKGEPVLNVLPKCLSKPWIEVSHSLALRPISCHAALVYYNYKLLDPNGPIDLSNLATLHTVSGGIDESWFYIVTVAIESAGASVPSLTLDILKYMQLNDIPSLAKSLSLLARIIDDMTAVLSRMNEHCDPYIFYHRVRIYFSGWSNMKNGYEGLVYEDDDFSVERLFSLEEGIEFIQPKSSAKTYPGGSAAQSALIHTLDILFGVVHLPTKQEDSVESSVENKVNFLKEMRYHMPGSFRRWLHDLESAPSVHSYLQKALLDKIGNGVEVSEALENFNQCIQCLKSFRDKHIQIVTQYIVIQARKAQEFPSTIDSNGYHGKVPYSSRQKSTPSEEKGTGGTQVIPFLKQVRNETSDALIK